MVKEGKNKGKTEGDGKNMQAVMEYLQAIARNQTELSERLEELEGTVHGKSGDGSALVKLANIYFNTDDKHIPELSFISPLAARPFAEAMALDSMTSEEVRSGKISLNKLLILNYLRFQRSVRGRLLGIGAEAMRDQISSEAKEEEMPEFRAGEE